MDNISRRTLLASGGALVVAFADQSIRPEHTTRHTCRRASAGPARPWLAIHQDGRASSPLSARWTRDKVDVAIRQIVAEELAVPVERVAIVMGDSMRTANQGGASGSTGVERGGITLRYAGAEVRRVLLDLASRHLGVPVVALQVRDGIVCVTADPTRQVSYAELIGDRQSDVPMQWNGVYGNGLVARGRAEPKRPTEYHIVGTSVPYRHPGEGLRPAQICHRYSSARHAARLHGPPRRYRQCADHRR